MVFLWLVLWAVVFLAEPVALEHVLDRETHVVRDVYQMAFVGEDRQEISATITREKSWEAVPFWVRYQVELPEPGRYSMVWLSNAPELGRNRSVTLPERTRHMLWSTPGDPADGYTYGPISASARGPCSGSKATRKRRLIECSP